MEPQSEYEMNSDKVQGRVDDVIHPADDEFRVVNVILHPLGQQGYGEGSLHRVINSPTYSESSTESWDPLQEFMRSREERPHRRRPQIPRRRRSPPAPAGGRGASRWQRRQQTRDFYAERKRNAETLQTGVGASKRKSYKRK